MKQQIHYHSYKGKDSQVFDSPSVARFVDRYILDIYKLLHKTSSGRTYMLTRIETIEGSTMTASVSTITLTRNQKVLGTENPTSVTLMTAMEGLNKLRVSFWMPDQGTKNIGKNS